MAEARGSFRLTRGGLKPLGTSPSTCNPKPFIEVQSQVLLRTSLLHAYSPRSPVKATQVECCSIASIPHTTKARGSTWQSLQPQPDVRMGQAKLVEAPQVTQVTRIPQRGCCLGRKPGHGRLGFGILMGLSTSRSKRPTGLWCSSKHAALGKVQAVPCLAACAALWTLCCSQLLVPEPGVHPQVQE